MSHNLCFKWLIRSWELLNTLQHHVQEETEKIFKHFGGDNSKQLTTAD